MKEPHERLFTFDRLFQRCHADYYALNISSPKHKMIYETCPTGEYFHKLIDEIANKREQTSKGFSKYKPIVVKNIIQRRH